MALLGAGGSSRILPARFSRLLAEPLPMLCGMSFPHAASAVAVITTVDDIRLPNHKVFRGGSRSPAEPSNQALFPTQHLDHYSPPLPHERARRERVP
eukprot:gnl/TRDRNA2_/TRDRNA2_166675_c0_seq4.p2 gnl/TRDRNA2_/TRDRNA2_166675_c0~~gnl/TRDRNA2_/TRDRNA2_166675_c0_seq4.p2  ORF type:complete len:106 (+),score=7.69 gnl/TRDRNA2_/TRDRNA2_166675_c0_seq4:28-318(+)